MSFSDDGWGLDEEDEATAGPVKNGAHNVVDQSFQDNHSPFTREPVSGSVSQKNNFPDVKPILQEVRHNFNSEVTVTAKSTLRAPQPTEVRTLANGNDDTWESIPTKREEERAFVAPKSVTRGPKLLPPPSRGSIVKRLPQTVDDSIILDFDSTRELSPVPPTEKPIKHEHLPPRVNRSAASSRKGGDFQKPDVEAGSSTSKVSGAFASNTDTLKPQGFGGEVSSWQATEKSFESNTERAVKSSGFGRQNSDVQQKFGSLGKRIETPERGEEDGWSVTAQPSGFSEPLHKTSSFGGIGGFGGEQKQSSRFGGPKFSGGAETEQAGGFGGQSKHSSAFGESENSRNLEGFGKPQVSREYGSNWTENPSSGFGKPNHGVFGDPECQNKRSNFGQHNTNAIDGSGFGSGGGGFGNGGGGFGENVRSSFGVDDGGFGGRENENRTKSGCFNCGGADHRKDECPNPRNPSGACRNCGEEGHFSKECQKPPNGPCRNCGVEGHWTRNCTEPRAPCRNCGQDGHFARECTNERVRIEPTEPCRRCNEEGHWASECPTKPRDLNGNPLVPYEVVFVPEEEIFNDAVDNDNRINFDQKVVASMGDSIIPDMASFEGFKILPTELHNNLKRMKMNRPTPIQRASFFPIFNGLDVVACAHTGCGKTLAFLIPLVTKLLDDLANYDGVRDEKPSPGLLIIAPTRELANQTFNTARQLTFETGLKCGLAFGGYSRSANLQHLCSFHQLNILVATMGRLQDFLDSGDISLEKMKFVVLDEADRMVDSTDFGEEVTKLLGPPEQRTSQTLLFSASFSENLQREDLPKFVKAGYTMLQVDKFGTANEIIDQHILPVPRSEKKSELCKLLGLDENTFTLLKNARIEKEKTLIFVNSVKYSDTLASFLTSCGVNSIAMHSHQNQEQRDRILEDFRKGRWSCMVSSNVCARGLNIAGLDHVINYDMPDKKDFDEYVNRIGRTGRAGFAGRSTAFVDEQSDQEIIPSLVNVLLEAKKEVPEWLDNIKDQAGACNEEEEDEW